MSPCRRAVIDIGTNSVKLLLAEVRGHDIDPVLEESEQTRLGRGFYEEHRLQAGPIRDTARAVSRLAGKARMHHAASIDLIATSAARDAQNATELKDAIQQSSGLAVRIITGEEEAELAYRGVTSNEVFRHRPLLILDVGGGSTEMIAGSGEHHLFRHSFPVGSVRLQERFPPSDPPAPGEQEQCRQWLAEQFPKPGDARFAIPLPVGSQEPIQLVGTGGSATILARMERQMTGYDRSQIDGLMLSRQRVRETLDRLWGLRLAERKLIVGLPPNRADIILMGVLIYDTLMDLYDHDTLAITTRGLRFGALRPLD